MATPFEEFVNRELPRRSAHLTQAITGYDGDPNDGGAPAIIQSAPLGTWFHEASEDRWWRKLNSGAWELGGGGGAGAPTAVSFTNQLQVDVTHNLGYRPIVQVLEQAVGGIFGADEGFGISFGSSDIYREIEPVHVEIHHLTGNAFRVLLDNYYTGEVLYF